MFRYIYTACEMFNHRKQLKEFVLVQELRCASVEELSPQELYAQGIRTLIVDFDGVLAPHAAPAPLPATQSWLAACVECFGKEQVFILSNKPTKEREKFFNKAKDSPTFVVAKRKKPFPDGIRAIVEICGRQKQEILVIDDRLVTGVLAAIIVGVKAILITQPKVDFSANPVREWFFMLLRIVEDWLFRSRSKGD